MKLTRIDLQVLDIVSRDARITIKDMAEECKASRSSVNQHLMSLIAAGAVASPGYQINPKILGYNTCTYVGIRIDKGSALKEVIEEIKLIDEVVECHITTGSYALMIKLYAKDNSDLLHILSERIQQINGISGTETLISLEMAFDRNIRIQHPPKR
ncbi:MAG: Lrp/AsnC family transcriptional regulator [Porphyromonas sp.]|nr:Lrp/AsnC family transcriptional regulator [Porphyromonas sp.]